MAGWQASFVRIIAAPRGRMCDRCLKQNVPEVIKNSILHLSGADMARKVAKSGKLVQPDTLPKPAKEPKKKNKSGTSASTLIKRYKTQVEEANRATSEAVAAKDSL